MSCVGAEVLRYALEQAEAEQAARRQQAERQRAAARRQAKVVADQMKRRSEALRYEKQKEQQALEEKNRRRQKAIRAAAQVTTFVAQSCDVLRVHSLLFGRVYLACR